MKTKLLINEDLKRYLHAEIDRSDDIVEELCKVFNREKFDWQWIFKFNDKYGVSVIKSCCCSYGFDDDLFELATVYFDGDRHGLYNLKGMDENPIGYLTNDEVMELLYKIKNIVEGETKNEN